MTDIDILSYLQSKGVSFKQAAVDEIHTACWFHGEDPSDRGRLYINIGPDPNTAGLYQCWVCGERGNLRTLMRYFGDELEKAPEGLDPRTRSHIFNAATDFYVSNLEQEHLDWLHSERGLTDETIERHRIGWADGRLYHHLSNLGYSDKDLLATGLVVMHKEAQENENGVFVLNGAIRTPHDFLRNRITIPYLVSGNAVTIRGKEIGGKYFSLPKPDNRLYNTDSVWHADTVVVTEGEFDCMLVEQMGHAAVGAPGAFSWQPAWQDYFTNCKRVYVAFDNDTSGISGLQKVRENLGAKVREITLPEVEGYAPGENDISEYFGKQGHTAEEFDELLAASDRSHTILLSVDDAFLEWEAMQGKEGIKLGFEELDAWIRPGLMPGNVVVTLAKTNTGKTLWLLNTFQRMAMVPGQENLKMLFVSLEQTRGDWFERARRIYNFYNLHTDPRELNAATLDFWRSRLMMTDVNRMTEDDFVRVVEDYAEVTGDMPDVVALDYLGYYARAFHGQNRYERVSDAIMSIKAASKKMRVTTLLPHQVSRTQEFGGKIDVDSGRDSGAVEETGDFVFSLYNPDTKKGTDLEERTGRVMLEIGKSRTGGKGREMAMQFGYLTLTMVPFSDPVYSRLAMDELGYDLRDDSSQVVSPWEAAIFRHKTGMRQGDITQLLMEERGVTQEET